MWLDTEVFVYVLSALALVIAVKWLFFWDTKKPTNSPPSPSMVPVFGNLLQMSAIPHRTLKLLADKLGPIMLLRLGKVPTLVVSSADVAREIFEIHDIAFGSRPDSEIMKLMVYNYKDLALASYSDHWKEMRAIFVTKLLSAKKVQSFRNVREEETMRMISKIEEAGPSPVNLTELISLLTNDVVCRVAFGRSYNQSGEGKKLTELLDEYSYLVGAFNIADYVPWLGWLNHFNGLNSSVKKVFRAVDSLMDQITEEHIQAAREEASDFVDILLEVHRDGSIDREGIKAMILDVFSAGTETTKAAMEWVMVELLRHRDVTKKVKEEIREVMGDKRMASEDDTRRLKYTKAVIKETMRMHPPVPILIPRVNIERVKVRGYEIEEKTRLLVNVWAIGMDPAVWDEPEEFRPERFLMDSAVDFLGNDFEFIPFGAGRKRCPGISFASAVLEMAVVTLLLNFDFVPAHGNDPNLNEASGLFNHPSSPLIVCATPI